MAVDNTLFSIYSYYLGYVFFFFLPQREDQINRVGNEKKRCEASCDGKKRSEFAAWVHCHQQLAVMMTTDRPHKHDPQYYVRPEDSRHTEKETMLSHLNQEILQNWRHLQIGSCQKQRPRQMRSQVPCFPYATQRTRPPKGSVTGVLESINPTFLIQFNLEKNCEATRGIAG